MSKIIFKKSSTKILAVGERSCYGIFLSKKDYNNAQKYIHSGYRFQWFESLQEAYEWVIITFVKFNSTNYLEFECLTLEDLLKKHTAFPYSERMKYLGAIRETQNSLLDV